MDPLQCIWTQHQHIRTLKTILQKLKMHLHMAITLTSSMLLGPCGQGLQCNFDLQAVQLTAASHHPLPTQRNTIRGLSCCPASNRDQQHAECSLTATGSGCRLVALIRSVQMCSCSTTAEWLSPARCSTLLQCCCKVYPGACAPPVPIRRPAMLSIAC